MDQLIEIYETLLELGLCKDQQEFSARWLGRSPGYMAYLRSAKARPSLTSLALLAALLREAAPLQDDSRQYLLRRRLLSCAIAAEVMHRGETEVQMVPRAFWCTAY